MSVTLNKDICSNLTPAESREWLITNGIGGYGAGTISGLLTRRYHGLLIAALKPPTQRTLMLTKLNETVAYNNLNYDLYSDRFGDGTIFRAIRFHEINTCILYSERDWSFCKVTPLG